jgi:hypothetical protein
MAGSMEKLRISEFVREGGLPEYVPELSSSEANQIITEDIKQGIADHQRLRMVLVGPAIAKANVWYSKTVKSLNDPEKIQEGYYQEAAKAVIMMALYEFALAAEFRYLHAASTGPLALQAERAQVQQSMKRLLTQAAERQAALNAKHVDAIVIQNEIGAASSSSQALVPQLTNPSVASMPKTLGLSWRTMSVKEARRYAVEYLQSRAQIVSRMASEDISVLGSTLSDPEMAAVAEQSRLFALTYGKGMERLTAQVIDADPVMGPFFKHLGGASQPDWAGRRVLQGMKFELTTEKQVPAHMDRPYSEGLNIATYERPVTTGQ